MGSLDGKVMAVTGAASGIGRATCKVLHDRGALLSIADAQGEALESVKAELQGSAAGARATVLATVVDVRNRQQVEAWIGNTVTTFGRLDGAANVAGIYARTCSVEDFDEEAWDDTLAVNLKGVLYCMSAQLRAMKAGASICNVASIAGLQGARDNAAYSASKHAVCGLTKSAAKEVGARGIRVNAVAPGFVDTPMTRPMQFPAEALERATALGRAAGPEEVGRVVAFLVGEDASYITGSVHVVDGGWMA